MQIYFEGSFSFCKDSILISIFTISIIFYISIWLLFLLLSIYSCTYLIYLHFTSPHMGLLHIYDAFLQFDHFEITVFSSFVNPHFSMVLTSRSGRNISLSPFQPELAFKLLFALHLFLSLLSEKRESMIFHLLLHGYISLIMNFSTITGNTDLVHISSCGNFIRNSFAFPSTKLLIFSMFKENSSSLQRW